MARVGFGRDETFDTGTYFAPGYYDAQRERETRDEPRATSPGRPVDIPDPPRTNVGPIPTNPNGSQVGSGIPWTGGRPSYDPPGYRWDESLAMFQPAPQPTNTNPNADVQWILDALNAPDVRSTDDPNYWIDRWNSGHLGTDRNWVIDAIRRGDGSALVKSGQLQRRGGGGGPNVSQFGYDDPSSLLYLTEVMKRLEQLRQPRHDPAEDQLAQLVQQLVARSQQAPYTAGDDAALIARYREPLTQARDAELRRNREQASARGFLPSSGLLRRMDTDVSDSYIRGMAGASNDLGVRAVDEKNRRALEALQALSGLVQNNRTTQDREDRTATELLRVASMFPEFDERRLATLLGASGEGPGAAIGGLTNLGRLGLGASELNSANSAGNASAWGQILGWILENL